jgi:hypothetical protein
MKKTVFPILFIALFFCIAACRWMKQRGPDQSEKPLGILAPSSLLQVRRLQTASMSFCIAARKTGYIMIATHAITLRLISSWKIRTTE